MKGCLAVLAFVVVAAAAVLGVVVFVLPDGPTSEESLTEQVEARVTDSEFDFDSRGSQQRGYAVDLRYRVGSTWYATQAWVPEDRWGPDQGPVPVCVDPDDPASVVVPTRANATCGDSSVGRNDPQTAKVSTAP